MASDPSFQNEIRFMRPFPRLAAVTRSLGMVKQEPEDDGQVRKLPLFMGKSVYYDDWLSDPDRVPGFGLKLLSLYEGKSPKSYLERFPNWIRINIRGKTKRVIGKTVDAKGETIEIEQEVFGIARIPAWKLLSNSLSADERKRFKGAIAIVGSSTVGAFDHYPTAFDSMSPGAEVYANFIDNLLHDSYFRSASGYAICLLIILFVSAVCFLSVRLSPFYTALSFLGMAVGWLAVSWISFQHLYILAFVGPMLAIAGTFSVLLIHRALMEEQQKREVRRMFGQYVSPEVVDILVQDPSKIRLGGDRRDMTVFFLDIAHFTTISEKMSPEKLIKFLNSYLTELTDIILKNHGVVDKYIGDCIMAFWNAPLEVPGHRVHACVAAVECIAAIEKLNREYVDPTIPERPSVRIGLNAGEVVVGNTGSARKLAYTVLGDDVNLASRLEGANKFFGSTIMVSENVYKEAAGVVEARELGRVRVVGKAIPIRVYELLAKKGALSEHWQQALPEYSKGVELYNAKDFSGALSHFEKALKVLPEDKPSKLYAELCKGYQKSPPAADWDGVFNLTSK